MPLWKLLAGPHVIVNLVGPRDSMENGNNQASLDQGSPIIRPKIHLEPGLRIRGAFTRIWIGPTSKNRIRIRPSKNKPNPDPDPIYVKKPDPDPTLEKQPGTGSYLSYN